MSDASTVTNRMDDHALEAIPDDQRQSWLQITWGTAGIVTTLIQLFIGALVTFVAGIKIGIMAGILVTICGALLGWGAGHIAYRTGLSSSFTSRAHGFGVRGSAVLALVFGFMIIGFLAVENALLYKGFLFYLGLPDTVGSRIIIYGILTIAWILLTAYGFNLVAKVSSIALIGFLLVLLYMIIDVIATSGQSWSSVLSFGAQLPPEALKSMGADTDAGKFAFAVNVLIGSAGALALVDADLGRYARKSSDIGIAALLGNVAMDIVMLAVGGMVMYAGMGQIVEYHVTVGHLTHEAAQALALQSPDSIAAAFIIFGGIIGTILMIFAQSKAQVLNTYSASLSLTSLFDALFSWRPGRLLFVILANLIACVMLVGSILDWFNSFLTVLGVLTTCFAGIMIADYFIVKRIQRSRGETELDVPNINWAGIITLIVAFVLAHYVLNKYISIEFFTSLPICIILYPILRFATMKKAA
jgi:cytosine permease